MNKKQCSQTPSGFIAGGLMLLSLLPAATCALPASAQTNTVQQQTANGLVTGRVLDATTGEPVIAASVLVKGTSTGTTTDVDGNFSIKARPNQKLVVSYLGYKTAEVDAKSGDIRLTDENNLLDEVVVVGYSTMRRKDVTSSISTVGAKDLNVGVYSNPSELLQGKVPGMVVSQDANPNAQNVHVTLRGASTFRSGAAQEPYYIVDGVPGVDLSMVAPGDIESIDVLRDASATAIYGSKAANGVIIVTTKKGQAGHTNVEYSMYVAFSKIAKKYDVFDADGYRDFLSSNGRSIAGGQDLGVNTDWQDEVSRMGFTHNHTLSISGGNDKTTYSTSFTYQNNSGVIKGTDMTRFNGRAYIQSKVLDDHLTLAMNLAGTIQQRNDVIGDVDGKSVYDGMAYFLPTSPVYNADGTWFENTGVTQYYNPMSLINEHTNFIKNQTILASGTAKYEIIPGLSANASYSYQQRKSNYNYYASSKSLLYQNADGYARRSEVEDSRKVLEVYGNFNRTFADVHTVGAMVGYSWEESNDGDGFQVTAQNFFDDSLKYYNMGLSNYQGRNDYGSNLLSTLRMISWYGRINYSYDSKYLLQASVRRDGSSAFGKNNRWATFPSVSAAWRLTQEEFLKDVQVLDDLKVRVGYGVSGNSLGFDVFTARQLYGGSGWTTDQYGNAIQSLVGARNANPDLKWEKTSMFNVGLDVSMLRNRLGATIEYYYKDTKDLIADYPVSTSKYLYGTMTANVGEVSNQGIEVTINAIPVQTRNFQWQTSINLSHNKNKVKKISSEEFQREYIEFGEADMHLRGQSGLVTQRIIEGEPIGTFFTYEWAGYNADGISQFYKHEKNGDRILDEDGNYVTTTTPDADDRVITGYAQPKLTMGWNNNLTYKNWTLTAFFTGVFGNKILNASRASLSNMSDLGSRNLLASVAETDLVTDGNSGILSDRYLENGSFFRLQTLSLSYNFGNFGKWVKNMRLSFTANNLFTITGYKGIDPALELSGRAPGIDNRHTYPRTRTYMIGMNLNF